MARQVLPIVGAVAGFVVGGPTGAQIGFALGSLVGNAVDPIEMQGRKLGDAPTQVAAEGGARAIVYGKGCIRATVVMERGGRRVIRQRDRSGGKGGGPTTINERALWTFAIGLGEAIPDGGLLRIWENEKLVYDVTPTSTIPGDTADFAERFRFYDGNESQLPDPALEALHGIGNAPYYRGTAYLVFPQYDLTDFGETVPTYRVEVGSSTTDASWPGETWTIEQATGWLGLGGVAESSERVVAGGNGGSMTYYADDSGTWVTVASPFPMNYFAEDSGVFVGVNTGANNEVGYGDGTSWSSAVLPMTLQKSGAAAGNGRFVLVGRRSVGPVISEALVASSPSSWTTHSIFSATNFVSGLAFGDGLFAAWTNSAEIWTSPNGEAPWTQRATPAIFSYMFWAEELSLWCALTGTTLYTSPDLVTWTLRSIPTGTYASGVWSAQLGLAVIVGSAGACATSPDLLTWTDMNTLPADRSYSGIDYSETWGKFIAVSNSPSSIVTSDSVPGGAVGDLVPLSLIVGDAHERCGHGVGDYNVSELGELVVGVVVESTVTGAEAINSIIGSHFADPSDYDGSVHYIKRGKPVVLTLTEDDLIDEPDEAQRNNAIEYPKKVHFLGQRADLAYASSKSTSSRYSDDAKVVGEITIGSPETYDDGTAPAEVAVKLHKVLWTEAEGEREWMIPDNYLGLVPTDNVGLSYRGELVRCRIINVEDTPGQRKLRMIRDRQSAYTANLTEIPNPPAPTPPQSSVVAPTIMAFIDSSALTDNADTLHYLVALSGANDNWAGAALQQQVGGNFTTIDSTTLNSIMGTVQNTVPDASPYYTDTTNQVIVRLFTEDELEAQTEELFLSNGGAFFLSWQDSGSTRWEIMQYRDCVQDSNGDWVLSHLMRGRKNTETAEHPPGAMFVWIDPSLLREPAQSSWLNTILTHRAVSNGQSPELATTQNNLYVGNSQREWPVSSIELDHTDPDTLLVHVVGRHRFGSSMNPIQSVNWLGLRILATDGTNTESFDTTSFDHSYDVTGWASPITVTVWQINRFTGLSEPVTEDIA